MTRDDIIQWAEEAGFRESWLNLWCDNFESFAALVAADARTAEREACAKVAEDRYFGNPGEFGDEVAAAIRARKDSA